MYKKVGSRLDINKEEFYQEMKLSKANDELTPRTIEFLIMMAEHGIRNSNLNYPEKMDEEDCIQSALYDMIKYWRNFEEDKYDNPFAFFSSFIFNGYAKEYKNIYKHRFVKCIKKYDIPFDSYFSPEKIRYELNNLYVRITGEIKERDILKCKMKVKCSVTTKWIEFAFDNLEFLESKELFAEAFCKHITSILVKIEYNHGEEFISLNQTGDNEIYNI